MDSLDPAQPDLVGRILADPQAAPIDGKLKVTLQFLAKMTQQPDQLAPADAAAVLAAGVTREALHDAINVAYLFNIYDRLADTLGWEVPDAATGYYKGTAKRLLSKGYA